MEFVVEIRCLICSKNFDSNGALDMHNSAKHPKGEKKEFNLKKARNYIILAVLVGIVAWFLFWGVSSIAKEIGACKTDPITEINIVDHQNAKLHIHSKLNILINGKQERIPANIGISPGVMRPLHTHELDNEIHNEGPCARDFKVGEFFEVWGKRFNSECIFDYCTNNGTLTMEVNGKNSDLFGDYVMRDDDIIKILYESEK
ncbi:MAG TPA: hypothetical protein VI544_01990 [Candidatus Nanoarchaeia archaeon]|nr:hypothetical protein [Candidatus Nanoarchaeia archaeon]